MVYILFIFAEETVWTARSEAEQAAVMREHERLEQDLRKSGRYRGCGGLEPTGSATTLRRRDGKTLISDGPYAETKEQLGGYYLVEAEDLDEVLAVAARIPTTANAAIEIRPVADFRT